MSNNLLLNTFNISLFLQVLIGIISIDAIFLKLKNNNKILYDTFITELIVQVIEGIFYFYIIKTFENNKNITNIRYIDWTITTPIMLITTILFMEYENQINNKKLTSINILKENKDDIIKILMYNYLMLLFGYLAENNNYYKNEFILVGFVFFVLTFYNIWNKFAKNKLINKQLFIFMFIIWALYGISAYMPKLQKNICYNILDVISKNFYGLFIYYRIKKLKNL